MQNQPKHWLFSPLCGVLPWFELASQQQATNSVNPARVLHTLNRLSFGATPAQIEQINSTGIEAYIQAQLSPESIPQSSKIENQLAQLDKLQTSVSELYAKYVISKKQRESLSKKKFKELLKERAQIYQQATEAHLARAIASPRQLQEVMVHFWFNHFNVFAKKNVTDLWIGDYESRIRNHALGNFHDLLLVTAKHPAMLLYLDNHLNTAPNSLRGKRRGRGLNENYARELLELHTLGVDGGYTQADVIALARILTGWSIDRQGSRGDKSGFLFLKRSHDFRDKVFLGTTIKGRGKEEVEEALDMLAHHPSSARFISYKLAQYFVADRPPTSLVEKLASTFQTTAGDIKSVLDTLFHSAEFNNTQYYNNKFKTPQQYIISLVRAAEIENPNYNRLRGMLNKLAMPIFLCPTPDGYENTQAFWLNPEAMIKRINLATAIANGSLNKEDSINLETIKASLGNNLSAKTRSTLDQTTPELRPALLLGSPEMMYR